MGHAQDEPLQKQSIWHRGTFSLTPRVLPSKACNATGNQPTRQGYGVQCGYCFVDEPNRSNLPNYEAVSFAVSVPHV
jgi:hypothetical protein